MADVTTSLIASARPALDEGLLRALAASLGEDAAAVQRRLAALARYEAADEPDRVRHLWRFTNPAALLPATIGTAAAGGAPARAPRPGDAAAVIDLWPGMAPVLETAPGLPEGTIMLAAGADAGLQPATDLFGAANVRRFAVSFREQVWKGDVLVCSGEVVDRHEDGERRVDLRLEVRRVGERRCPEGRLLPLARLSHLRCRGGDCGGGSGEQADHGCGHKPRCESPVRPDVMARPGTVP